ncbi:MAG TPA: ATP-dependent DNA ligase [Methanocorpusculum sp.]|nr:ATP-dependent DNA ligase [Methanocorpusculum sp.]
MLFREFANYCNSLELLSSKNAMVSRLSEILLDVSIEELPIFVRFIQGKIFPDWASKKINIGPNVLYESLAYVIGKDREFVIKAVNCSGEPGKTVESLLEKREQTMFFSENLGLIDVYNIFIKISDTSGRKSQQERMRSIQYLLSNASPIEGRYISRLMLEEMRIGVGESVVLKSIAECFSIPISILEHAHQALNDLGEVAVMAKSDPESLRNINITPFKPVKMMLAQSSSITEMISLHGEVAAENKYDGSRFQFHKVGAESKIYSRRLEDMTESLPDVVDLLSSSTTHDLIIDGEIIALENGRPKPFQTVLRRIRRKHDVSAVIDTISLEPRVFDILVCDGETLIDKPFKERRKILENVMTRFVVPQIVSQSQDEIESFYHTALDDGNEGIMLKVLDSTYIPGNRGRMWVKIKPQVDTMDLVVIGAEWGEGKRANVFGSFLLACQDDSGNLIEISHVATGIDESTLSDLYNILKPTIVSEQGKNVKFEPQIIFEVGYSELQKSTTYPSGYALRFPKFIRIRDDKDIIDIETVSSLLRRYSIQNKC